MADKIQIRAGNKIGMPTLTDRELAYVRDENALYIGTPNGNKEINGELKEQIAGKLTASAVAAQVGVASDAGIGEVASALNALIAAMKSSGVMNT